MLKSEFQERIGRYADDEAYDAANAVYNHYEGDKDAFCKEWKEFSPAMELAVEKLCGDIRDLKEERDRLRDDLDDFDDRVKGTVLELLEDDYESKAVYELCSIGEIVEFKLNRDIDLSAADKSFILESIK